MKFLDAALEFKFFMWVMGIFTACVVGVWAFKMVLLLGAGLKLYFASLPGVEQIIKFMEWMGK